MNPIPLPLLEEWHPTKNLELIPEKLTAGSNRKVWWLCAKGHEWEAVIANRAARHGACPYCSGRHPILGETDLATINPAVLRQWSNKNKQTPYNYVSGSSIKAFWICENGHEFILPIRDFVARNYTCPECSRNVRSAAFNLPEHLLEAWDYENNITSPEHASVGSNTKYHWQCKKGHKWEATIPNVKKRLNVCPVCSGRSFVSGVNDLVTIYPNLSKKWDLVQNDYLPPSDAPSGGGEKRYWRQQCGHTVKASISEMLRHPNRCGYCSGQKVLQGFNDLPTIHPSLSSEWHPHLNGTALPSEFVSGSGYVAWWQCAKGHEWKASILNRAKGNSCPYCSNRKVLSGYNDIQTLHPEIAQQWATDNKFTPRQVTRQSKYLATWKCDRGHQWETAVYNRTGNNNTGCPTCWATTFVSKAEQAIFDFVVSLGVVAEQSNRSLLGNRRELDIYVPEKKVAIEFHGLYWHTESAGKDKSYHQAKWQACKDQGIQLIQVWEDEWNRNPEQIKRMLAHKLGVSIERKLFARKTSIHSLKRDEAETFLNENHVQGFASGSYYLGLKEKSSGELVSVLVLKKEAGSAGKVLNIIRYATSVNVVGGFTKLLTHSERTHKPESFITFADHGVSDGGLYENNGFVVDKVLAPDYMYVVGGERKHKFGYRLKRFQSDPELKWAEGLTEKELASLNGLERVWDSGKTRYRKTL